MITIKDLKERWFNAYPEIMGISGDKPIQCYAKKDVDECLAGIEAVPRTDNSAVIAKLLDERRWHKCSEELPPKYTWCLVSGKSQMGNYIVIMDFFEKDDWAENPNLDDDTLDIEYWMPLPSAPKEAE